MVTYFYYLVAIIIYLIINLSRALKQNVLFIIVDDLRPSLGAYDDPNAYTPNLDKLSSKSFIFENVYAQQALCAPSRNSLLTSRRPDSLHLYDFYSYWRTTVGNFTTLPQLFKENGYYTQSIGKVFHPGASCNFSDDSPYSWSGIPFHPKSLVFENSSVCLHANGKFTRNLLCPVVVETQPGRTLPDIESQRAAIDFIKNEKKTWFLAIGLHKPHIPFRFPVQYLNFHPLNKVSLPKNRWYPPGLPQVAWNPWMDVKSRDDISKLKISFPFGRISHNLNRKIIQHYNAATSYIDDLIGGILNEVNDKNTIIVVTSDHGWSRGEHGEFAKYSNFRVATQIPLIIKIPGLTKKQVKVKESIELVDLFPTLVDLTQVSANIETCSIDGKNSKLCTEGKSFLPLLIQAKKFMVPRKHKSAVFSQYPRPAAYPSFNSDRPKLKDIKIMGYSIKTAMFRYTEWIKFNSSSFLPDWSTVYGAELYSLLNDPEENLNLVDRPQMENVLKEMRNRLILGWRAA